jgi:hypothetical protein
MDTQSVKTAGTVPAEEQGIDPGKEIVGRKRGIFTDTLGLILAILVTAASLSDNAHGIALLDQVHANHPEISIAWVDQGFRKQVAERGRTQLRHPHVRPQTRTRLRETSLEQQSHDLPGQDRHSHKTTHRAKRADLARMLTRHQPPDPKPL